MAARALPALLFACRAAGSAPRGGGCTTELDCELNGACTDGAC
eukprot:gene27255-42785_t